MKYPSVLLATSILFSGAGLIADEMTVSIDGFGDPTTFSITESSDLSLRVTELVPAEGDNLSTHVLIEGLSPLEDGTMTYASTYSGINVDSGEVQDVGVLFLDMPEGSALPEGTVSSPVVGVVQRTGSWGDYSLSYPATSVGGSTGAGDYDTGSIQLSLVRDAESFTGTATYTVLDENTIELDPFTLTSTNLNSYNMSGATLLRDGARFYGTLTNLTTGALYDSLIFAIQFTGIPDVDGDGVPDISDGEISAGGLVFNVGGYIYDDLLSWTYGLTTEWGSSQMLGTVFGGYHPEILYTTALGWLLAPSGTAATGIYFYRVPTDGSAEGWIWTIESYGGFYWNYATGSWGSVF
ncbi:MAG: hypothetical protein AB3N33_10555 [Puniceicoccaceae bacterium]